MEYWCKKMRYWCNDIVSTLGDSILDTEPCNKNIEIEDTGIWVNCESCSNKITEDEYFKYIKGENNE